MSCEGKILEKSFLWGTIASGNGAWLSFGVVKYQFVHSLPIVSSADYLCKQCGPRSGSKLCDTLMVFMKEFFEKSV